MDFRIKELCKEKGLLFKELAQQLGITDVGLRQSLQGNPTIGTLEKIAVALGVTFRPSTDEHYHVPEMRCCAGGEGTGIIV